MTQDHADPPTDQIQIARPHRLVHSTEPLGMAELAASLGDLAALLDGLAEMSAGGSDIAPDEVRSHRRHLLALLHFFPAATATLTPADIRSAVTAAAEAAEGWFAAAPTTPADRRTLGSHARRLRDLQGSLVAAVRAHRRLVGVEVLACPIDEQAGALAARIDREPPAGTPEPVATAYRAVISGILTATDFVRRLPRMWDGPDEYRAAAARVQTAAAEAARAYRAAEAPLLHAAGPDRGAFLEVVKFLAGLAERCPDRDHDEGELNRTLVGIARYQHGMPGDELIRRLRTQAVAAGGFISALPVAKPTPVGKAGVKPRTKPSAVGLKGRVYLTIRALRLKGLTEKDILEHLKRPEETDLAERVDALLRQEPTVSRGRNKGKRRTRRDVVQAALRDTYAKKGKPPA